MSKVEMLRVVVTERLTAAAEEIFGVFKRTIAEYEEELSRSKRENERQRKLLDAVLKPEVRLYRADVQLDSEPPQMKEEQEHHRSSHEGEQLQGPVPVKSEGDEGQSSQLHQMQEENSEAEPPASTSAQLMEMESNGEDHGGSETTRSLDPDSLSQPANDEETPDSSKQADPVKYTQAGVSASQPARYDKTSDCRGPEIEDSDGGQEETRKPQSDLKTQTNNGGARGDKECNTGKKSFSCSKCGKTFKPNRKSAPGMEPFICSACVERSLQSARLITKKIAHSGENLFRCSVCKRQFSYKGDAVRHIRIHTGEKPFGCSVCGRRFTQSTSLDSHMRTHTGEKPFGCSLCPKRFIRSGVLDRHMRVHTGEKPYSCSECNTSFTLSQSLLKHMRIHTGEKPFSCSVCDKKFIQKGHLTQHMTLHTGERSFSCQVCGRKFSRQSRVKKHKCVTESSSSSK